MRIIRRYRNRKLYDSVGSQYVTLSEVAGLIRRGEEIRVLEHGTSRDLTSATLAQIVSEEEKHRPRLGVENLVRIIRRGLPS